MPIGLILLCVFGGIAVVFCIIMAIITAIVKAIANGGSSVKRIEKNKERALEALSNDGFKISRVHEAKMYAYQKGEAIKMPFVGFYVDQPNRRIAIASYKKGTLNYFGFDEIRRFEFLEKIKVGKKMNCLKKLNLVIQAKGSKEPCVVKILQYKIYSVSKIYGQILNYKNTVSEILTEIIKTR